MSAHSGEVAGGLFHCCYRVMTAMDYSELPPCEGPKLHRFPDYPDVPIQWISRIDQRVGIPDNEIEDDEEPGSYVFEVKIGDKKYAIKVFRFHNPLDSEGFWGPLVGNTLPLEEVIYYQDPFFNECRAYGRVEATIRKRRPSMAVVIPCHGFILLRPQEERKIQRVDPSIDFGRNDIDNRVQERVAGGMRVRAIVKDLASEECGVNTRTISKIYRGLKNLNRVGIFDSDVDIRNFRDGKAVDFGSAWTEPHKVMRGFNDEFYNDAKLVDMMRFDEMVQDEGIRTSCVGIRHVEDYRTKLRPRKS